MVLSGASFKMKTTLATDTVVGITRVKLLTAATIATWTLLFSGTLAEVSNQKCYACGPQADILYPDANSPPCENFTETEQFTVDCGDGDYYCAITATPKTHVVSRICTKNQTEDCTQSGVDDGMICVCDGSLCNGISLAEQLYKSHPSNKHNKTAISGEDSKEWSEMTTIHMIDHNEVINEPIVLTGNEERKDTGIHISPEVLNHETVTSHSLPLPAALGQDNKQGAPVDDEEDTSEGSGSRIESEQRSSTLPTTTTEHVTTVMTTTEQMKSGASSSSYEKYLLKLTLAITVAYSLYF